MIFSRGPEKYCYIYDYAVIITNYKKKGYGEIYPVLHIHTYIHTYIYNMHRL